MSSSARPASAAPSSFTFSTEVPAKRTLFDHERTVDELRKAKLKESPTTPPCTPIHKSAFYVIKKGTPAKK